jgi:hypothetical protein
VENKDLQAKYDEMHKQGSSAWFSDGREERETIRKMGEPWKDVQVCEIGCGEGDLGNMLVDSGAAYYGLDYSWEAIKRAHSKYPGIAYWNEDYRRMIPTPGQTIVMQGVLEHLDDPFGELQWMIEHFKPKTVITSSPCFLNPRGIVWMTLDMLGAVMSKTDLHFLHPWQFEEFCEKYGYILTKQPCDTSWGYDEAMISDLRQRIPLAVRDGGLPLSRVKIEQFIHWLSEARNEFRGIIYEGIAIGATMVYRIDV